MIVGYPHPNEPIGGLTALSFLNLLKKSNEHLLGLDVEWNIIPCIDPDGEILNESWSLKKFKFDRFMKNYHRQRVEDQTERSFPVHIENYRFNKPSPMTKALMKALKKIRLDFYFSLHNATWGRSLFFY